MRSLERHIRFRLHPILQAQQDLQEPRSAGGLIGDANVSPTELRQGDSREQEDTSRLLDTGDAKTCHRLKAIFQAETVRQRDWSRIDLAVFSGNDYGARHHLIQLDAAAHHVKVEGLSVEIRDATYSYGHHYVSNMLAIPCMTHLHEPPSKS